MGILISLTLFMFNSPLRRIYQTSKHLIQVPTTAIRTTMSSSSERPTGLIGKSGIELLTFGTPNGHKASIILEELKAAYGKEYIYQSINIMENIQKESWFTKFSPNGRIPAIVDHDRNDFSVFEGAAILSYLTRHYDPEHKFSFTDPDDLSIVARPAVKAGLAVPSESRIVNEAYLRRLKEEDGFKEAEDKLKDLGDKAKEQYGYKFASP